MTHAGISRGLKNSPLDCFLCAAAHRPVRFLARDTRKNTPAQAGVFFGDPYGNRTSIILQISFNAIRTNDNFITGMDFIKGYFYICVVQSVVLFI